ncbi:MAG: hypothetical protein RIF41_35150, partial [Polyangiaceae bacterium]
LDWTAASGTTAAWLLSAISVATLGLGGAWIGALRGCAGGLVAVIEELDLVARLYERLRPHVHAYANALRDGARGAEARARAMVGWREETDETERGAGLAERAERFVARTLHAIVAGQLLKALLDDADEDDTRDWIAVEAAGQARALEATADLVRGMVLAPTIVAGLLSVLMALSPHALHALLNAP